MKKKFIFFTTLLFLFSFIMTPRAAVGVYYDDLTTLNFAKRVEEFDFNSIKKFCSYDFCEYREGESIKEALDLFTKRYLNTIEDREVRSILAIKGIKITKIVFQD